MKQKILLGLYSLLFFGVVFCDRITKAWAWSLGEMRYKLHDLIACQVTFNRGISWGMLQSQSMFPFMVLTASIILVITLIAFHAYIRYKKGLLIFGEVLVLAGAFSNVFDRFYYGGVLDFIECSYRGWVWPSFNIADAAIVIGVSAMFITGWKGE